MNSLRTCPVDAVLDAVALGVVQEPLLDWCAEHLGACDACCDRLEGMSRRNRRRPDTGHDESAATLEMEPAPDDVAGLLRNLTMIASGPGAAPPETGWSSRPAAIGPFRIERQVGVGATAVVYEAIDAHLDRRVILKVLRPDVVPNRLSRDVLMAEARALAAIDHPHVMPLYQVQWHGDEPVLVLPSLAGRTLAEALATGIGDWKKAVGIVRDIADAIDFTHTLGVVHRDIKPSNIWLRSDPDGVERPLLFDFGLAGITSSGAGTPGYVPPAGAVKDGDDRAADVFSLAVVLFEATRRAAGAPAHLHATTSRLLAAGPGERPTAADMRREMDRLLDRPLGRRAWIGGLAGIAGAAVIASIVVPAWMRPATSAGSLDPEPYATFRNADDAPFAVSEDAATFCGLDDRGRVVIEQRHARPSRVVRAVPFRPTSLAVRNRASGQLVAVAGGDRLEIFADGARGAMAEYQGIGRVQGLAWAGEDDRTLVVHAGGTLFTARQSPDGSFPQRLAATLLWRDWSATNDAVTAVACMSSFDYVVFAVMDSTILVWSLGEAVLKNVLRLEPVSMVGSLVPMAIGWRSLDGFYVVKGKRLTSFHMLPNMTEEVDLPAAVSSVVWLDGNLIAFVPSEGSHAGRLGCIVQSNPAAIRWISPAGDRITGLASARNRTTLVAGSADGRVMLFDAARVKAAVMAGSARAVIDPALPGR